MTLRWRLSALSLAVLLTLLVVGGAFQYFALSSILYRDEAVQVRQRLPQGVRELRVTRGTPCLAPGGGRPAPGVIAGQLNPVVARCIAGSVAGPRVTATILTLDGAELASSPAPDTVQLPANALADAARGRARNYYLSGSGDGERLVVLQPLGNRTRPALGVLQLSESTSGLQGTLQRLLVVLAIATGILTLLALVAIPTLVSRALRPLRRVTEASAALAGGDLSRRVGAPATHDEVGKLARAFNDMAAAVERAIAIRTESEEGVRQFLGDASHELRTPLTTLQGQLHLLRRDGGGDAQRHSVAAMEREVQRMTGLVEDLLTLTRLDSAAGGPVPVREPVDLDRMIAETVEEQSVRAADQVVEVETSGPAAEVMGDPDQLRRLLLNLAQNAVAYAPGGVHRWSTRWSPGEVALSLSDEGGGIPPDVLPHVFDRFYRGPANPPGRPGGSGLGLAIVRSIAEAHGGRVGVESNEHGTTFTVQLPTGSEGVASASST